MEKDIATVEKLSLITLPRIFINQESEAWCIGDLPASYNGVEFASQSVPAAMLTGQSYTVSVTMNNVGPNTWTDAANYHLGSRNPEDNGTWGLNRVSLPGPVSPGNPATFSFLVTAPTTPGTYNFEWRMVQEGVEWFGEYSPNVAVVVSAPALTLSASAGDSQVSLSWTDTSGAVSYDVKRSATSGGPYTTIASNQTGTTYTDTGLTNGTTYFYIMSGVSGSGQEYINSNEANATPGVQSPTDLAAYATGSGKITLYWSAVPNATGYNIYRGTTAGGEDYEYPVNGNTPITTLDNGPGVTNIYLFTDTGLSNGTEYFYTIKAVVNGTETAASNEDSAIPDPTAIPWDTEECLN